MSRSGSNKEGEKEKAMSGLLTRRTNDEFGGHGLTTDTSSMKVGESSEELVRVELQRNERTEC